MPPLIVLVARFRRFVAASGDAPGSLEAGGGVGTLAQGTGTPIFGVAREASAWATKMRKVLKEKSGGVGRALHSVGALRQCRGLIGSEKDYRQAVNYLRSFARYIKYNDYRGVGLPIGSGVTDAACKIIVNYRFKQSGMCWHCETGQHVLDL